MDNVCVSELHITWVLSQSFLIANSKGFAPVLGGSLVFLKN